MLRRGAERIETILYLDLNKITSGQTDRQAERTSRQTDGRTDREAHTHIEREIEAQRRRQLRKAIRRKTKHKFSLFHDLGSITLSTRPRRDHNALHGVCACVRVWAYKVHEMNFVFYYRAGYRSVLPCLSFPLPLGIYIYISIC